MKLLACLLMASSMLSGCAAMQSRSPEEIVGERATAQADALMRADFETALSFMAPSYRDNPRSESYARDRAGAPGWTDATLKWVKCEQVPDPEKCDVRMLIKMSRPPMVNTPILVPLDDVWIKVSGQWYQYD